ncbi:TnsA endonuclease N-terminal domain-containing protein [Bacillus sp. N1-1]|uniref:TnsA endonuclease N-terminal domain-containing protein n=1 Tax=Bacillus sp. N1-1 TaxID=2682541 RepID=UPI001F105C65|nr:TnsA endonuclease N-terminal domain-containing protein [Bacillus sp. N1-1]
MTEKKIAQMEKEGRGVGHGEEYKPWINIQDFPSSGLATRTKGWKTKRIHQFLSKLERDYFYIMEWSDVVVDIREQYPLVREDTVSIASELGLKHPLDPTTKVPIVMTTDFLLTLKTSKGTVYLARTIKPSGELEKQRTMEKFEIERSYWESRGIDWAIVTERDLPKMVIENIEWLHSSYFKFEEIKENVLMTYKEKMKLHISNYNTSIIEVVTEFDQQYHLEEGMGLEILKQMIAHKELKIDINNKILTHLWIEDVFQ